MSTNLAYVADLACINKKKLNADPAALVTWETVPAISGTHIVLQYTLAWQPALNRSNK